MIPGKKIQLTDNMSTKDRAILCLSEIAATAILVFLGCMGCVSGVGGGVPTHLQICFTFGLAVMVSVQVFGHISGSHINPLVTVAAVTLGNIPLIQVPIFFVGQFLGALLGFGLLKAVTPDILMGNIYVHTANETIKKVGVCSPAIAANIETGQGLLVEFLISFILALVCCGVWDPKNSDKHDSVAIRFGLTIAVLAMAAGPYTGANMNPVRSFAPALFNGDWKDHWVYWVGPLAGGFAAALFYRLAFSKDAPQSNKTSPEELPLNDKPNA